MNIYMDVCTHIFVLCVYICVHMCVCMNSSELAYIVPLEHPCLLAIHNSKDIKSDYLLIKD